MQFSKPWTIAISLLFACGLIPNGHAQQQPVKVEQSASPKPKITNARLQELSAASGLKATMDGLVQKQAGPFWIGYRIPAAAKERTLCCFDSVDSIERQKNRCCMGCRMESEKGGSFSGTVSDCSPEPLPYAFIFYRAEARQITKARVYSPDCALDFANLPLYWLEDVKPEQSVELLTGMVMAENAEETQFEKKKPARQAIMAIAMHDVPAADAALGKFIQPTQRLKLREDVAFWLGVERGKKGLELLRKYI